MNLFKFYVWLHEEENLKVCDPVTGSEYQGKTDGGIFNYPARSFVVDIDINDYIFRVICSSNDGCLCISVVLISAPGSVLVPRLKQLLSEKLQNYVDAVNRLMIGSPVVELPETITISFADKPGGKINVHVAERTAQNLTYGEALGLLAQLLPCDKQNLNWLQSEQDRKELAARDARHHGNEGQWP
jgi:hypothetical protein